MHDAPDQNLETAPPSSQQSELAIDPSLIPRHDQPTTATPSIKEKDSTMKNKKLISALIVVVAIASGVGTGYGLYRVNNGADMPSQEAGTVNLNVGSPEGKVQVGQAYGSPNESDFKDSAEGIIQKGGIDGEGSHRLTREGGVSQTVYLTSSVVDLDEFDGAKVKIWGETFSAQKAGWLMDVGRVKVLELNAPLPEE